MRFCSGVLLCFAMASAASAQLAIVNPTFHEYEAGPIVSATSEFQPGDTVFFSFQISGFKATGEEDDHIQLTWRIRATDATDRLIGEPKEGKIEAELAPEDKKGKWMPRVRYHVQIPREAAAGDYIIHVSVEDVLGKQQATKDVPVHVAGKTAVAPADSLTVEGFQFLRSDREQDVLPPDGTYGPGDTVWARFEITGYKFATKNRYAVGYGLTLADETGKVIFDQPKAAADSDESFYPKQAVPAILNLKLDPKIAAGTYVLTLHVSDTVGNQQINPSFPFRIEK